MLVEDSPLLVAARTRRTCAASPQSAAADGASASTALLTVAARERSRARTRASRRRVNVKDSFCRPISMLRSVRAPVFRPCSDRASARRATVIVAVTKGEWTQDDSTVSSRPENIESGGRLFLARRRRGSVAGHDTPATGVVVLDSTSRPELEAEGVPAIWCGWSAGRRDAGFRSDRIALTRSSRRDRTQMPLRRLIPSRPSRVAGFAPEPKPNRRPPVHIGITKPDLQSHWHRHIVSSTSSDGAVASHPHLGRRRFTTDGNCNKAPATRSR